MEGDSPDAPFRVPYYSDIGSLSSEICAMCNSPGDNIEQTIFSIIDIFTACPHRIKLINIIDLQLSKLTIPLNIWTSVIEKVRASTVSYRSDEDKLHIVAFLCCLLRSLSCCLTSPILTNCAERESMNQLVSFLGEHLEASFWSSQVTATQKFYSFLPSFVHSLQGLITHRFIGGEVFSRIWVPSDLLYPLALFCVSSKSCSDEWVIQSRTKTIELYTKKIMGAKSPLLTNQSLKLLSIFIQTVTQEEWSGVADVGLEVEVASTRYCSEPLDAATMKALKKAPEGSSRAVSCLLAQLPMQLDVSSFVLQGAPGIALRMIKSAAASVRCSGLRLFENILLRSRQTDAFDAVLNTLLDALQDKSGLLSNSSQKLLVSVALSTSAVALPKVLRENQTFLSSTSADCIPIILTCLDKETDEGVKWQLSRALSSWLHIDPTQRMSDYFLEMVKVAIAKARPNLMYLLMPCVALARSLIVEKSANKLESLEALVAPLIGLLKECMKKPLSVQPEAALSLELLLSLAARLPNVLTLITIQKLFGLVTAHNSPLHTVTFLNTMLIAGFREKSLLAVSPKSDDMLLTLPAVFEGESEELEEAMLMQKRGVCEQTVFLAATITQSVSLTAQLSPPALLAIEEPLDQAGPSFTRTALFLALHPSAQIRKQTCAHIANTLDAMKSVESSVIESTLLTGLRTHIEMLSGKLSEKRIANSAADTHTSSTVSSPNPLRIPTAAEFSLFLNAILTKYTSAKTVTHPKVLSSQFLADILIIIGHPFVGSNVCKKLLTMIKSSTSCDLTVGSLLVKQTSSPVESMHTAGTNAILLLFTYFGGEGIALVGGSVTSELVAKLVACDLSNISADDLRTYRNPEGAMTVALSKLEVSEDDVKITNADRKKTTNRAERRGQFGADVVEDEDWAERVKQEKMKKLQSERAGGVADASVKARQQVNEIVSRVDGLLREAVNSLHCLQCLFESVRDHIAGKSISAGLLSAICGIIAHVLDPVLSHLKSDLLHDRAYATLRAITALIDSDLREFSSDLAASLRGVALSQGSEGVTTLVSFLGPITRLIKGLGSSNKFVNFRRIKQASLATGSTNLTNCVSYATTVVVMPVLRALLLQSNYLPGCESSFYILDCIWPMSNMESADELRKRLTPAFLSLVLTSASLHPRSEPRPEDLLSRALVQMPDLLNEPELRELVGDKGLLNKEHFARHVVLKGLLEYTIKCPAGMKLSMFPLVESRLWLATHDVNEACRADAKLLWQYLTELSAVRASLAYSESITELFSHETVCVRESASHALASCLAVNPDGACKALESVKGLLLTVQPPPPPQAAPQREILRSEFPEKKSAPINASKVSSLMMIGNATKPVVKTKPIETSKVFSAPQVFQPVKVSPQVTAQNLKKENIRHTIALFFSKVGSEKVLKSLNDAKLVCTLVEFILTNGATDQSEVVRDAMLVAGRALIDGYCDSSEYCSTVLATIRSILALKLPPKSSDFEVQAFDKRRGAGVVLLGAAGKHLQKDDPAVIEITDSLVEALKTPSESVQRTVADCLAPLIQVLKGSDHAGALLEKLMKQTLEGESFGDRRGGAFGVSACVKGLGIPSLKQFDVVPRLRDACSDGDANARQGSLFALECLADRLGLLFEPYVISVVPVLLKSFSNSSDYVREAAQGAAKVIMSRLSAHGVKQMITPVLNSLPEESQWKSRQEAIRLLGMMANCAPKQLSACLPQIIQMLVEAGSDPHPKVKESAKAALNEIASVVKNPELLNLSPVLLAALADPANKTRDALEALLETEFLHSIDAPSLALLAPILGRALKDRTADVKRKASAITGNIMSMVSDPKNITPYTSTLLPGIKSCLVDPIPDVRATAAKALGALVGGVGEDQEELKNVLPWLFLTLCSDGSPVERSGAAQGLSELCLFLGESKLRKVLADALPLKNHPKYAPREGLLWLLSFLPSSMTSMFGPFVPMTLPVILDGLGDENEGVREIALRAGQVLVGVLGKDFTFEILPALLQSLFAADHRIRLHSVSLLGELLYLVAETKGVGAGADDDDDDDTGASSNSSRVMNTLRSCLGEVMCNSIFASLYIVRCDLVSAVRHAALAVWKSCVSNTPRTLVEVSGELAKQVVQKLASPEEEPRIVAGRALGEVVKKLGDRILPSVVPHLQQGLTSKDAAARQGVCLGLGEILSAASKKQVEDYLPLFLNALQTALQDDDEDVRTQAAKAFQTLFRCVGVRAIEEVVPSLLEHIAEASGEGGGKQDAALIALRELVHARPRELLEYLLPELMTSPMQTASAQIFGAVAEACSGQLIYHFNFLVPVFASELQFVHELILHSQSGDADKVVRIKGDEDDNEEDEEDYDDDEEGDDDDDEGDDDDFEDIADDESPEELAERFAAIKAAASAVFATVDSQGVGFLLSELSGLIEHEEDPSGRRWGCWILEQFLKGTSADFDEYTPLILRFLMSRVAETNKEVQIAMVDALTALVNASQLDNLMRHIDFMRNCMTSTCSDARHRPGMSELLAPSGSSSAPNSFILPIFSTPKALDPFVALLLHALLNGSANIRESAADGLTEVLASTDAVALKPYLIKVTGPLIRVLGDRYPSEVKAAILRALSVLLDKGGAGLKAFAPQLQTTFVKNLADSSKTVRQRAVHALGQVMALSTRVDPLLSELCALCASNSGQSVGGDGDNAPVSAGHAIKASLIKGLASVLHQSGDKASPASLDKVRSVLMGSLSEDDENVRLTVARCMGGVTAFLEPAQITDLLLDLQAVPTGGPASSGATEASRVLAIAGALQCSGQRAAEVRGEASNSIRAALVDERFNVRISAAHAIRLLLEPPSYSGAEERRTEFKACAVAALHLFADGISVAAADIQSGEVRKAAIGAIKESAKRYPQAAARHLQLFVPPLMAALKDINISVKYVAERALKYLLDSGNPQALAAFETGATIAGNIDLIKSVRDCVKYSLAKMSAADSDDEKDH